MKKSLLMSLIILGLLLGAVCKQSAIETCEGYWVPADPPKCGYLIDAKIDFEEGFVEGRETVTLKNDFDFFIDKIAWDWEKSADFSIDIAANGETPVLLNSKENDTAESPLFYRLPDPLRPGERIQFDVLFKRVFEVEEDDPGFTSTYWYPRIRWDGLPKHDFFSVKLDIPEGYEPAVSGRLNEKNGRYEIDGAKSFGIHLAKDQKSETREVDGIQVTALFTEKGAMAAAACLDTAVDAVKYYKDWLGFYPFEFLYIIPGGPGRWGGYPFATGIVVIHGEETFKEGEPLTHWQRITAHEIGHEYWGEWILDPERPAWVWIGMGIFADTDYILTRDIDPGRRQGWMSNYLQGITMHYDTTVDIPPARLDKILYDHNNTVIHSKGFSIISALDSVLGRETFERIYKNCLRVYGGKRLGWRELQRFFEKESGQNLTWFFDQWVRSNKYLCYKIEGTKSDPHGEGFLSTIRVRQLGTITMPVPVKAVFEDASEQVKQTSRNLEVQDLTFLSPSKLKEAVINPEHKLAMLEEPLAEISEEAAELLALGWGSGDSPGIYNKIKDEKLSNSGLLYRIGMGLFESEEYPDAFDCFRKITQLETDTITKFASFGWMGLLKDIVGERAEAVGFYKQALEYDEGKSVSTGFRERISREWLEERLKTPFTLETLVDIPAKPTAEELEEIVDGLNWKGEGKTPFYIYEKARDLEVDSRSFWFKLGMLLFDSGYYPEAFTAMDKVSRMETSDLYIFAAYTWMGQIKDLLGEREEALKYYSLALEHDTGSTMTHSQFRMKINRAWVEKLLETPFTWRKR